MTLGVVFLSLWMVQTLGEVRYAAIHGNVGELGYYYVNLWVGSPPVKRALLIDTGSSLTAFPCTGCQNCGTHMGSYFNPLRSSTSRSVSCSEARCSECKNNTCHYRQIYSEGSLISGVFIQDLVSLEHKSNNVSIPFTFGCHYAETNLFRTQKVDGVLGLAVSMSSHFNHIPTIIDGFVSPENDESGLFAICLGHRGGVLTLGGVSDLLHSGPLQSCRIHGESHFMLNFPGLKIGGSGLIENLSPYATLLDSGTTFIYLSKPLHDSFWRAFISICKGKCGLEVAVPGEHKPCYRHQKGPLKDFWGGFPDVVVLLDDIEVKWTPKNYLFTWPDLPHDYCVGVYVSDGTENVLGSLFMRGLDIVFNRRNNMISFAPSICDMRVITQKLDPYSSDLDREDNSQVFAYLAIVVFFTFTSTYIIWIKTMRTKSI